MSGLIRKVIAVFFFAGAFALLPCLAFAKDKPAVRLVPHRAQTIASINGEVQHTRPKKEVPQAARARLAYPDSGFAPLPQPYPAAKYLILALAWCAAVSLVAAAAYQYKMRQLAKRYASRRRR